jgi:hypothetical protein
LLKLAGGRTTDEEIRRETRERVKKHRDKRSKSPSVTPPNVTEKLPVQTWMTGNDVDPVSSAERRRIAASLEDPVSRSAFHLAEFIAARQSHLPFLVVEEHQQKARDMVATLTGTPVQKRKAA